MMKAYCGVLLLLAAIMVGVSSLDHVHHDNAFIQTYLTSVNTQYPAITKLYSVGKSIEGVDLWVIAIGKDINATVTLRPHVKYIGNMHGNEVVSRELLLHLIDHYVTQYATNSTIQAFLDSTVVHIMPTMNPDGYNISDEGVCGGVKGRYNKNGIDLNRNFLDTWHDNHQKPVQVETQHVLDWLPQYNFVLSANLHGGAVVANYPFDQYRTADQSWPEPSVSPDDDVYRHLCLLYARTHPTMATLNGTECRGDFFQDGITNGAEWYPVAGGMQDYNYLEHGILETTLEVSCCKHPNASELQGLWEANRDALLVYLKEVHRGVKGIITDENSNPVVGAQVYIVGRELVPFPSKIGGEYYRILMPGTYTMKVVADNYMIETNSFEVREGQVTRLDVQLVRSPLTHVHHDNTFVATYLQEIHNRYPTFTKLYSIGQSIEGVDLWVIAIGKDINATVTLRPHVKYIGNMHGNEVVSRELLLHLIDHYVTQYATNSTIQAFLDSTVVHIMPTMNPDGYNISDEGVCGGVKGRYNKNGIDLNRNFPDTWHDNHQKPVQVETQHVIDWLPQYNFVLSANLHGGAVVANYPFDQYRTADQSWPEPSVSPDDDVYRHLSLLYARTHPTMAALNGTECPGDFFQDGITNGAEWYPVAGGMQDYNYLEHGILETTLEVSCCKHPNASELQGLWEANRDALLVYLEEVHRGVKGIITDENSNPVVGAQVYIVGRELVPFPSKIGGEYYRILMPGTYTMKVVADNYMIETRNFEVREGQVTRHDVQLVRSPLTHVHHDNTFVATYLQEIHNRYPTFTKLYSIGQSIEGVDLWVLAIGKDIDAYVELRPHVKYIGNMHGNEVVSRELLLHLIDHYVSRYNVDQRTTAFLDSTVVHIMPTMNPDGYSISEEGDCMSVKGRYNKNRIDLNRNFPDTWHDNHQKPVQVESQHVIDWLPQYNFVLSANLHGGALVVVFPYDQYPEANQTSRGPALCPDDDVYRHLSLLYARTHPTMAALNGTECEGDFFPDGIINGADWYPVAGGMQDYNYLEYGILETTLEVSCCKYPNASDLEGLWNANKDALLVYLEEVHRGVKGIITDENSDPLVGAKMHIVGRETVPFASKLYGEYYRMLMPGNYTIQVSMDEYLTTRAEFTVKEGRVTRLDIQLDPQPDSARIGGTLSSQQGALLSLVKVALLSLIMYFLS